MLMFSLSKKALRARCHGMSDVPCLSLSMAVILVCSVLRSPEVSQPGAAATPSYSPFRPLAPQLPGSLDLDPKSP